LTLVVVAVLVVILGSAASSGGGSSRRGLQTTGAVSLSHIRARNIRLQEMIVLMKERQMRGLPAGSAGPTPAKRVHPSATASVASEISEETAEPESEECDPNYQGACLDPNASDYDCAGGSGNGPDYTGEVIVVGEDHFGLDADGDGIGCEAE
jgi:hypothetical protein